MHLKNGLQFIEQFIAHRKLRGSTETEEEKKNKIMERWLRARQRGMMEEEKKRRGARGGAVRR